jgi:multiple sugar transport system substrate-binding protein
MVQFNSKATRMIAVGLVAAAALATAGCSGGGSGGGKTTVTFLNWEATEDTPLGEAITQFEKENPDITVDIQPTVIGNGYDAKMRTALAGNNPPDVFRINDDYVQQFTENGTLLDLAPYVKDAGLKDSDYAPQVFNFGKQSDGKLTSWQIGYQPAMVFYNKDLFEKAGLPLPPTTWSAEGWTWDDFLNDAKKLTDGTTTYGAIVTPSTNFEQTFAHNNGSPTGIWSEDGTGFTLADPVASDAIQWAADLTCVDNVQPRWADLLQPNTNVQLFTQGKAAMLFALAGSVPYFRDNIKSFDWDVAAPPAGKADQASEASVVAFGVPAKAKNHDAAFKLLNFLASEEGGQIVGKGGAFTPVNVKAAQALYADPSAAPASVALLGESSQHLTATSKTANTLGARQIYRPALDDVYNCKSSASDVLSKVKPQVEQALAQG